MSGVAVFNSEMVTGNDDNETCISKNELIAILSLPEQHP